MECNTDKTKCNILEQLPIAWMLMEDGTRVMPFIGGIDGVKYRVNYCPSCGKYIRDLKIPNK